MCVNIQKHKKNVSKTSLDKARLFTNSITFFLVSPFHVKIFTAGPNPQPPHEYVNYRFLHIRSTFCGFFWFCFVLFIRHNFLPSYSLLPRAFRDRLTTSCVLLQQRQGTQIRAPPSAPGQSGMWAIMTILKDRHCYSRVWRPGKHPWIRVRNLAAA